MTTEFNDEPIPEVRYLNRNRRSCCAVPFVILFRERSGSTYLCSLLNSHPDIFCRHEDFDVFAADEADSSGKILRFKHKLYRRRINTLDDTFIDDPTTSQAIDHFRQIMSQRRRKACGFKFKFDIQTACYPEIVDELHWLKNQFRVIQVSRQNLLKQAVSRQNMERLQALKATANLQQQIELPAIHLDVDEAIRYASRIKLHLEKFNIAAQRFPNLLTVTYEQLLADPANVLQEVLKFLDVEPAKKLSAAFQKATPDQLSIAVQNYDELVKAARGTCFETFLD